MAIDKNKDFRDPLEVSAMIQNDDRWWKDLKSSERDLIEYKVTRAVIQLIVKYPFFGYIATKMSNSKIYIKHENQLSGGMKFKTMATDGKLLYIWPQYALYNDVQEIMGTIMHEILHVMLLHISRGEGYNQELANISMDYVVNMMVNDFAKEVISEPKTAALTNDLYVNMPWYVACPPALHDERWRDKKTTDPWQWEKIYAELLKQQDPETQKKLSQGMSISESTGGGGLKGQSPGQGMHDSHEFWDPKKRPSNEKGETNTEKFDPAAARDMVRDAYIQASEQKMQGTMPASMQRIIHEWLHPPLPWQRLVQNYLKPTMGDFGYTPGDTRFDDPIPWFIPEQKLRYIVISIDTSGSMSDQEVGAAITQARHLLKGFTGTKGILCMCDARVDYWEDINETFRIDRRVGYGGTSFFPPFEKIFEKKIQDEVDLHIYFTDGYGQFPTDEWMKDKKVNFDTLWVITNQDVQVPKSKKYKWTRLNPLIAAPKQ